MKKSEIIKKVAPCSLMCHTCSAYGDGIICVSAKTLLKYLEGIGDYYYPCLTIENEEPPALTKYGRMRERYLREHKKVLYCNLLTSGKLYEHLAEIDTSACNMAEYLIKEMARKQGVTEQLKAEDMMRWVGLMNNIRTCADEIVLNDIVYS